MPGRSSRQDQAHNGYQRGDYQDDPYQSPRYQGDQHQRNGYPSGGYNSGSYDGSEYYDGGYPGSTYQNGQRREPPTGQGFPTVPPPSARTLEEIRSADQLITAALSQQQVGSGRIQDHAAQYLSGITRNLDPSDRRAPQIGSYRYATVINEDLDQQSARQEGTTSSRDYGSNDSGRTQQTRRQGPSPPGRPSRNDSTSSARGEHRENRNNSRR